MNSPMGWKQVAWRALGALTITCAGPAACARETPVEVSAVSPAVASAPEYQVLTPREEVSGDGAVRVRVRVRCAKSNSRCTTISLRLRAGWTTSDAVGKSFKGDKDIWVTADRNLSYDLSRIALVEFVNSRGTALASMTIQQRAARDIQTVFDLPPGNSFLRLPVRVPAGTPWTSEMPSDGSVAWAERPAAMSGVGPAERILTVFKNPGLARIITFRVAGVSYTVRQEGSVLLTGAYPWLQDATVTVTCAATSLNVVLFWKRQVRGFQPTPIPGNARDWLSLNPRVPFVSSAQGTSWALNLKNNASPTPRMAEFTVERRKFTVVQLACGGF